MAELDLYNIDRITKDVEMQEIGFSHLFHDLVDHICCDVEFQMEQGMSFEDAYKTVKGNIGFRGLKKIQEETLYAVDTKYRNMKNLMKISGVTGTIMIGFAAIFKIAHFPAAGILLTLGALILSFLFLPSALTVLWKETKSRKKLILFISAFIAGVGFILGMLFKIQHWPGSAFVISLGLIAGMFFFIPSLLNQLFLDKEKKYKRPLYIAGALSILIYCTGFWFKIMHWPSAGWLILSGSVLLLLIVFPWFTWVQWRGEVHVNARFIFMVIAPLLFVLPGALLNMNLERNYEDGFRSRIKKQEALATLQEKSNYNLLEHYRDSVSFPRMKIIHTASCELTDVIRHIEQNMVLIAEGSPDQVNTAIIELSGSVTYAQVDYGTIKKPFHRSPAALMLLPGCKARQILEKEISDYNIILTNELGNEWIKLYNPLINSLDFLPVQEVKGFELALIPTINGLTTLKSGVLVTETAALKQIASE